MKPENKLSNKIKLAQKRCWRIRKKISGTAERLRLSVSFSGKHIYAQCIDDEKGETLVFLSTLAKEVRGKGIKANIAGAAALGKLFGERAKSAGIEKIVLDRSGRRYHGCVKSFAEAVREAGLVF